MIRSTVAREVLVAVPGNQEDLYLRHQQVWDAAGRRFGARAGFNTVHEFLFRRESPQIYRLRSSTFQPAGAQAVALPTSGTSYRFDIELVAMRGSDHSEPVHPPHLNDWVESLLGRNGFKVSAFSSNSLAWHRGVKQIKDRPGSSMRIAYQIARVAGTLSVSDTALAQAAFTSGIGRGRRFGFGMLDLLRLARPVHQR